MKMDGLDGRIWDYCVDVTKVFILEQTDLMFQKIDKTLEHKMQYLINEYESGLQPYITLSLSYELYPDHGEMVVTGTNFQDILLYQVLFSAAKEKYPVLLST